MAMRAAALIDVKHERWFGRWPVGWMIDPVDRVVAFDARRPDQPRSCSLQWQQSSGEFRDPCDGTTVTADGAGLLAYPVTVTDDGEVIVDLNPDRSGSSTTAAP